MCSYLVLLQALLIFVQISACANLQLYFLELLSLKMIFGQLVSLLWTLNEAVIYSAVRLITQ